MKLYTEEQVRHAIKMARSSHNIFTTPFLYDQDEILDILTPIELPTDDYIVEAEKYPYGGRGGSKRMAFIEGAKWVIEYIKKQK